jgi:hypothetical protein
MAQWTEQPDAGDLPATAQTPIGGGPLATITGNNDASDVDMFCIRVDNPATFSAQTCDAAGATWDTQLFLFREDGVGVAMDDDTCASGLQSQMGSFAGCTNANTPGQYLIAISRYNRDPRGAANEILFASSTGCTTATAPVASWTGTTTAGGTYTITFTSVSYCGATAVEPSTWGSIKNIYK